MSDHISKLVIREWWLRDITYVAKRLRSLVTTDLSAEGFAKEIDQMADCLEGLRKRMEEITAEPVAEPVATEVASEPAAVEQAAAEPARTTRAARAHFSGRATMFVRLDQGRFSIVGQRTWKRSGPVPLGVLLGEAVANKVARVFVCDGPDFAKSEPGETRAAAVRRWLTQEIMGWRSLGHYVPMPTHDLDLTRDARTPVGRWEHVDTGLVVELHRAGAWFGVDGEFSVDACTTAWSTMESLIAQRFRGGVLLSTPASTGRDLWLRSLPHGKEIPVQSRDMLDLIRASMGQGRRELLVRDAASVAGDTVPEIAYYDGRLMYAGLVGNMPIGEPEYIAPGVFAGMTDAHRQRVLMRPSRLRVIATVPRDWDHVGILMEESNDAGRRWAWPSEPGATVETWADGREVELAIRMGWTVDVRAGYVWKEGKILDKWASSLVDAADQVDQWMRGADPRQAEVLGLIRAGLRAMVIHGIGAFASRMHPRVFDVGMDEEADPRGLAIGGVRREGDRLVWVEEDTLPGWSADMEHPEWAARIYGLARAKLLSGWNGMSEVLNAHADKPRNKRIHVGALHVPRADVLAFATDGIYLASDPRWEDCGRAGQFRLKGRVPGPVPAPRTWGQLFAYRDQMI